jgi:hypothetical protein
VFDCIADLWFPNRAPRGEPSEADPTNMVVPKTIPASNASRARFSTMGGPEAPFTKDYVPQRQRPIRGGGWGAIALSAY